MVSFQLGQDSLEVCKIIVQHHPEILSIKLVAHEVGVNWRQLHKSNSNKFKFLSDGFKHPEYIKSKEYQRGEFLKLKTMELPPLKKNCVWSITSKVKCRGGKSKHIPLMNFHYKKSLIKDIKKVLRHVCGKQSGVLLDSGRFFHYYGDFLLNEVKWNRFLAEFLMPTIVVSPRYIGHRLHEGYCTLRLTASEPHKPQIPKVIEIL